MFFFIVCEWLYNMNLCMRVIMYIINLFLCCVCFVIIWYVCVTTVFSFLNVYNKSMFMTWYIVQHVITLYSTINKNNLIKLVSDV